MPSLDPLSHFRLDGTTAIVTGASSGLGERFARVLHAVGANVVVAARRADRLTALCDDLPGAHPVTVDLSRPEDRERLVADAIEHFGSIGVLVNNAGTNDPTGIEHETLESFRNVVELNLTAVWHLSKLVGPSMIAAGGGSIINIASILGLVASSPIKQSSYCATKGALINLSRELAVQWARKGIRVNSLCPGWFPSELTHVMEGDEGSQRFIATNSPIPRMGRDYELDAALLMLAGPGGSFITGQSIVVDGGWTAR